MTKVSISAGNIRRLLAATLGMTTAMQLTMQSALAAPVNVDLSSTTKSVAAPSQLGSGSVVIREGTTAKTVGTQSALTPAENMAVWQVLTTGHQSLRLGALGNAIGGSFHIGSWLSQNMNNLVIPRGVTSIDSASAVNVLAGIFDSGRFVV